LRARPGFWVFVLVLYGGSGLVQWAMWRWLRRVAPDFVERYRRWLLGVLGGLFLLPLTRELSFFVPGFFRWPVLAAIGMLWHLTVWMSMAAIGLASGVRRLLRLRGRTESAAPTSPHRRIVLERIGGALAFTASGAVLGWGSLRGRYEWVVEEVPIRLARLPKALDGFTIVQISDLHVGTFIAERELAMGLGLVAGLRPDLIVITGDIVDVDTSFIPLAA